jgi:hypothetical protein
LFNDSDGTYNSDQESCIVSGIFYNDLDWETHSVEELEEEYHRVEKQSQIAGYNLLKADEAKLGDRDLIVIAKECKFLNFRDKKGIREGY